MLLFTCVSLSLYIYNYMYTVYHTYIHLILCMYVYIYIHTCFYIYIYIYTHKYVYTYTYVASYIYIYTYTLSYTYVYSMYTYIQCLCARTMHIYKSRCLSFPGSPAISHSVADRNEVRSRPPLRPWDQMGVSPWKIILLSNPGYPIYKWVN